MAGKQVASSLNAELAAKYAAKYNPEMLQEGRLWINSVLGNDALTSNDTFGKDLKSGVILCNLVNKIKPGIIKKINESSLAFKQMENLQLYTKACKSLGMSDQDLFVVQDVYNDQPTGLITLAINIHALGSLSQSVAGYNGPILGVKHAEKNIRTFTDEQLLNAKNAPTLLSKGSTGGASQAGMFDTSRQIVRLTDGWSPGMPILSKEHKAGVLDMEKQVEVLLWMEDLLGTHLPSSDLSSALSDGTVLCKVMEKIAPKYVVDYHDNPVSTVHKVDNCRLFLQAANALEIKSSRCFPQDIVHRKNTHRLLLVLHELIRVAFRLGVTSGGDDHDDDDEYDEYDADADADADADVDVDDAVDAGIVGENDETTTKASQISQANEQTVDDAIIKVSDINNGKALLTDEDQIQSQSTNNKNLTIQIETSTTTTTPTAITTPKASTSAKTPSADQTPRTAATPKTIVPEPTFFHDIYSDILGETENESVSDESFEAQRQQEAAIQVEVERIMQEKHKQLEVKMRLKRDEEEERKQRELAAFEAERAAAEAAKAAEVAAAAAMVAMAAAATAASLAEEEERKKLEEQQEAAAAYAKAREISLALKEEEEQKEEEQRLKEKAAKIAAEELERIKLQKEQEEQKIAAEAFARAREASLAMKEQAEANEAAENSRREEEKRLEEIERRRKAEEEDEKERARKLVEAEAEAAIADAKRKEEELRRQLHTAEEEKQKLEELAALEAKAALEAEAAAVASLSAAAAIAVANAEKEESIGSGNISKSDSGTNLNKESGTTTTAATTSNTTADTVDEDNDAEDEGSDSNAVRVEATVALQVKELRETTLKNSKSSQSEDERLRKKSLVVQELLQTEKDYVRDLQIVIDIFKQPMTEINIVKKDVSDVIFSNIEMLLNVNREFCKMIVEDNTNHIGQAFLTFSELFKWYGIYCGNQAKQMSVVSQLSKNDSKFQGFLRQCQENPICRRLDLMSFLIKPMQRLTKYPLLLKEIVKYTSIDNAEEDYETLLSAYSRMQEIALVVNDHVRILKQNERVFQIQNTLKDYNKQLFQPHRRIVFELKYFKVNAKGEKRSKEKKALLLFTDIVLFVKVVKDHFVFEEEWSVSSSLARMYPNLANAVELCNMMERKKILIFPEQIGEETQFVTSLEKLGREQLEAEMRQIRIAKAESQAKQQKKVATTAVTTTATGVTSSGAPIPAGSSTSSPVTSSVSSGGNASKSSGKQSFFSIDLSSTSTPAASSITFGKDKKIIITADNNNSNSSSNNNSSNGSSRNITGEEGKDKMFIRVFIHQSLGVSKEFVSVFVVQGVSAQSFVESVCTSLFKPKQLKQLLAQNSKQQGLPQLFYMTKTATVPFKTTDVPFDICKLNAKTNGFQLLLAPANTAINA